MVDIEKTVKQCPVELSLNIITKKWVVQIIRDMFFGKEHFNEFKEDKPELTNTVLSRCLKDMQENNLIEKTIDPDDSSVIYKLTNKGKALNKIIYDLAMYTVETDVSNKYYEEDDKKEIQEMFKDKLDIDE